MNQINEYDTRESRVAVSIEYHYDEPVGQRIFVHVEQEGPSPEPATGRW